MKRINLTKESLFIIIFIFLILLTSKLTQAFVSLDIPLWLVVLFWIGVVAIGIVVIWSLVSLSIGIIKLVKKGKSRNQKDRTE